MYFFSPPDFNDLRRDIVMISITMEGIAKNFKDGHSGWGVFP